MARAQKYDKEQLLADWKAGGYSQRKLAKKHGISTGMVAKLTKGVIKESEQLVSDLVQVNQGLAAKTEKEVSAISEQVSNRLQDEEMIRRLTKNNMVGVSKKLVNHMKLSMLDHKNAQDLIDKASVTLGVNERHSKPTQVSQTSQTVISDGRGLVGLLEEAERYIEAEQVNE